MTPQKNPRVQKPQKAELDDTTKKSMNYSIAEGSLMSASNNIPGTYVAPYLLSFNASNAEIGILTSLQSMGEIFSQLPGARLTRHFPRKFIWYFSTFISKLLWLPIIFIPMFLPQPVLPLLALLFFISLFSSLRAPAWQSMMGDIVPKDIRGRYFGKRNSIIEFFGMLSIFTGGILLTLYGFSTIFWISIALGFFAMFFFRYMTEPPFKKKYSYSQEFSLRGLFSGIRENKSFATFTAFMTFVNFSVDFAGPFIVVYMLKDLQISYALYATALSIGMITKIFFYRYWGKITDRFGAKKVLILTAIMISFVPFGYMLAFDIYTIILVKIWNGFSWSGFNQVVFNSVLGLTPSEKRPEYIGKYNFISGMGTIFGAFIGGIFAESLKNTSLFWLQGLQIIFLISFILRLCSLAFLAKIKGAESKEEAVPISSVFFSVISEPTNDIKNILHLTTEQTTKYATKINHIKRKIEVSRFETKEYEELPSDLKARMPKEIRSHIVLEKLAAPKDADRVIQRIDGKVILFVNFKKLLERPEELKYALEKIKKQCESKNSQIIFVDKVNMIILPNDIRLAEVTG